MIRKIKVLTLAAVAVLALSALGANAASGATFTSNKAETTLKAASTGHHVFDAAGTSITCGKAEFTGSQTGTEAASVTMTASYSECKFLFVNVNVNMNGCAYQFNASGTVAVVDDSECKGITFEGAGCKVVVPKQSGLSSVGYANSSGKINVTPAVTGIKYTSSGCISNGEQTNGNYTTGPATVESTNGATISHDA